MEFHPVLCAGRRLVRCAPVWPHSQGLFLASGLPTPRQFPSLALPLMTWSQHMSTWVWRSQVLGDRTWNKPLRPQCVGPQGSLKAGCRRACVDTRTTSLYSGLPARCVGTDRSVAMAGGVGAVRGMAGHSKWANIRHIKAAKDSDRARVINMYTRKIRAFIRETGHTDPKTSSQLARLMAEAKAKNVPSTNLDRVLSQMSSLKNSAPVVFAARGPAGSMMLIEALTTSMNQTRAQLQAIVKKCGFSMSDAGSLGGTAFEEKGVVVVGVAQGTTPDLEPFVDLAIEAGAEDVTLEEDEDGSTVMQFVCDPGEVYSVKKELEGRHLEVMSADRVYNSMSTVVLERPVLELISKAMDKLQDHPDVLRVFINVQPAD